MMKATAISVLLIPLTAVLSLPNPVLLSPRDTSPATPNVAKFHTDLGPHLSKDAAIYFPGSAEFANDTHRWSAFTTPTYVAVVEPAIADDVAATVKFANKVGLPFLTVNKGHATPSTISRLKYGINIYIRAMHDIAIAPDGNTALMQGGVSSDQAIKYLDTHHKTLATTAGTCVGMVGSGMGGGFGRYQGYFGLVADNFISYDLVTADGSQIVVSETSHPDLYWGMRGAGHNFGIVTSFRYKIHDYPSGRDWAYFLCIFTEDKLEAFFETLNMLGNRGKQPVELTTYNLLAMNPDVSDKPVLIFQLFYSGSFATAAPYLKPFLALKPSVVTNGTAAYPNLADQIAQGVSAPICQDQTKSWALFPVGLVEYNSTSNREIYELLVDLFAKHPDFNGSVVQLEGYSMQGVQAVPDESTAYAHRADNLLVSFTGLYTPTAASDEIAIQYGEKARKIFHAGEPGRPLNTYVNYAYGTESQEQLYGYAPWRQAKLKALKKKWDPENRFAYYNPITL